MGGLGLMILLGATAGYAAIDAAPSLMATIFDFGVSALLYLVTEELLVEAS
jgi:zinc transporter ZupT